MPNNELSKNLGKKILEKYTESIGELQDHSKGSDLELGALSTCIVEEVSQVIRKNNSISGIGRSLFFSIKVKL